MKKLNQIRLLSGLPIDPTIEVTESKQQITEARKVPGRRAELTAKDSKTLTATVSNIKSAVKHVEQAIKALEKIPATDFNGEVPAFINELEDLLHEGSSMKAYLESCMSSLRKTKRSENAKLKADAENEEAGMAANGTTSIREGFDEEHLDDEDIPTPGDEEPMDDVEATDDEDIGDDEEDVKIVRPSDAEDDGDEDMGDEDIDAVHDEVADDEVEDEDMVESVHIYKDAYTDYESDVAKPVNVSKGSSNAEQTYSAADPKNTKDESPSQLHTGDAKSEQDQSDGHDLEADFKVPNTIKSSLKAEITNIRAEAKKLGSTRKESAYFYEDTAKAFEDLLGLLEKGTRYDFKKAQVFAQSLMGPMLHKIPADVWKFITNGGETRSLKDYMKKVKDPITGPRNTIK